MWQVTVWNTMFSSGLLIITFGKLCLTWMTELHVNWFDRIYFIMLYLKFIGTCVLMAMQRYLLYYALFQLIFASNKSQILSCRFLWQQDVYGYCWCLDKTDCFVESWVLSVFMQHWTWFTFFSDWSIEDVLDQELFYPCTDWNFSFFKLIYGPCKKRRDF